MQPIMLVVAALAVARLTGLVVADSITAPARDALLERLNPDRVVHRMLEALISCPWCVSMWISAPIAPIVWWHGTHPAVAIPALALGFSWVAGASSNLGRA